MRWWIGGIVLVLAALVAWMLLKPPPNAGDRGKLARGFSAAERQLVETRTVGPDELAGATCADGAPCWIAVDGVVYDMGVFPTWARGIHHGVKAGQDDTEQFVRSGHAVAVLQKMPVVGAYRP